jgi:putative peptide zinc metalloprotease protein
MAIVQTETNLWEVLAGREPRQPIAPTAPDLWREVTDRLNPAKARPVLREGVEEATHTSLRGQPYVMARSPDREASYLRLTPAQIELVHRMDGTRTVAQLVGEYARLSGQLAPDQVTRLVADLAGARLLDELPRDAFAPLEKVRRPSLPVRAGKGFSAAARGQRMVIARPDRFVGFLYRFGGRLLFTRPGAVVVALVSLIGVGLFVSTWSGGAQQAFVVNDSYALGALVLLALNVFCLLCHEMGHAMGVKHAGRRCGAVGVLCYFGIPSAFVDTTDVWMADRRKRLITSAVGPLSNLSLAGTALIVAYFEPSLAPLAFKLSFAWYLNALFNLNPLMALDGYYLFMDWIEIANLRSRAIAFLINVIRTWRVRWKTLDRENRYVAMYGVASVLWLVIMANIGIRMYKDRVSGLIAGLWYSGWPARLLLVAFVVGLLSPLVYAIVGWSGRRVRRARDRRREKRRELDQPRRLATLAGTRLGKLPPEVLGALADASTWIHPRRGGTVQAAGASFPGLVAVVEGALEGRKAGDTPGTVRERAMPGDLVGLAGTLSGSVSPMTWSAAGTSLLLVDRDAVLREVAPLVPAVPSEQGEAEAVLASTTALGTVSDEQRMALVRSMRHIDVGAGESFHLSDPAAAALVGTGVLATNGSEVRAGDLVGPPGNGPVQAEARTQARLWRIPVGGSVPLLLGAHARALKNHEEIQFEAPRDGVHGTGAYPPLTPPPGPPPETDGEEDDRLSRRFVLLLILLLLLALGTTAMNIPAGMAWAETPDDTLLLEVDAGTIDAIVDGEQWVLGEGDRITLRRDDQVFVHRRSSGRLLYHGGGETLLCPETELDVGELDTTGDDRRHPSAELMLHRSKVLTDTEPVTDDFAPVELQIEADDSDIASEQQVEFSATAGARVEVVETSDGEVTLDDELVERDATELQCGHGDEPAERKRRRSTGAPGSSEAPTATTAPTTAPTSAGVAPTTDSDEPATTEGPTPRRPRRPTPTPPPATVPNTPPPTSPNTPPPTQPTTTRPRTTTTYCPPVRVC